MGGVPVWLSGGGYWRAVWRVGRGKMVFGGWRNLGSFTLLTYLLTYLLYFTVLYFTLLYFTYFTVSLTLLTCVTSDRHERDAAAPLIMSAHV